MIRDLESVFAAHDLHFADDLADEALLDQLRRQRRLQGDRHAAVPLAEIAIGLRHRDFDVLRQEVDRAVCKIEVQLARRVQLRFRRVAVHLRQCVLDGAHALSGFRAQYLELRLEAVRKIRFHVVLEGDGLDVQLALDDFDEIGRQRALRLDEEIRDGLAVLDIRFVAGGAAQHDDLEHQLHVFLQRLVDIRFVRLREVAEMDALRRILVHRADKVAVDALRDERHHGRGSLHKRRQRGVEGHVGVDLVLFHALRPEPFAAAAHIPVGKLFDKFLQYLRRFRNAIGGKMAVHFLDHRVETGQDPFIHDAEGRLVQRVFRRIEIVDVRVQHIERVGVPKRAHEFALAFLHRRVMEAVRQPRRAVLVEVPADRVGAMAAQRVHRIDGVALGFRHLLPVLILHMAEHDDVLVRGLLEQQRGNGDQRIEPSARLVDRLGNEIRREAFFKDFLVLERIMPLGKGHRAGVKPAVDDFRHAVHLAAAFFAFDGHIVDIRAVQLDVVGAVVGQGFQFFDGADGMLAAAFALPDIERRAPVTVAADAPILHMLEPVAEAALADGRRNPVHGVVVRDQLVADRRHADEPRLPRVVE